MSHVTKGLSIHRPYTIATTHCFFGDRDVVRLLLVSSVTNGTPERVRGCTGARR